MANRLIIRSLKTTTGKGAVLLPHGVLFRGNAGAGIRANLNRRGYSKGIIGLPANLNNGNDFCRLERKECYAP
ncbi:MAG: N-6 DNA methylase [Elusimicrobia bacterium]|nr:N-6 DNA methylase [Elusimicrobiota bacterium]